MVRDTGVSHYIKPKFQLKRRITMSNCEKCRFRGTYDKNPKSFLGRIWKWHIGWCPGWKSYLKSLPAEKRDQLKKRYGTP